MKEFVYATRHNASRLYERFRRLASDRRGSVSCPPILTVIIGGILGLIVGAVITFYPDIFVSIK